MTEIKEKSHKGFEIFTDPNKIVNYSKKHGSYLKYSLMILLAATLLGFNYFQSNFMLPLFSSIPRIYPIILLLALVIFTAFLVLYPFLIWVMVRVYLKISDKKRNNDEEINNKADTITRDNLLNRLLVISYCFLIPFLFYEVISFFLTILLYLLDIIYLVVIIKDFGTILTYVWIIPLTLHSIKDLDKSQKYKMEAFVLIALFFSYIVQYFTVFTVSQVIAKILPTIV